MQEQYFLKQQRCESFGRGNLNAAPAWQAQAKNVRDILSVVRCFSSDFDRDSKIRYMFAPSSVRAQGSHGPRRHSAPFRTSSKRTWKRESWPP